MDRPLTPTEEMDRTLLRELWNETILTVDLENVDLEGITLIKDDDEYNYSIQTFNVPWTLALPQEGPSLAKYTENLDDLIGDMEKWPNNWHDEYILFHKDLALQKCLHYLRIQLEDHQLFLKTGERIKLVVSNSLKHFSVAQMYNFIWRATKDAAAFSLRENTTKSHAVNTVPGAIERATERALAQGWEIKPFGRDFRAPQSMVAHILYSKALRIGDDGFNKVIK